MIGPAGVAGAGFVIGAVAALTVDLLLTLVEALWLRRPRPVAVAALAGAAVADAILALIGGSLGWAIVTVLGDPSTRATIAIGLFVGVAAKVAVSLLIGRWGVPPDAQLPTSPVRTAARFAAITLLAPTPALIATASVVAWPRTWAFGVGWAFVLGMAGGALALRAGWAWTGKNRVGVRSPRKTTQGLRICAIVMLAALALGALPR